MITHFFKVAGDDGLKTTLPSPEMILWKQLHHLCKGARDDGSKTTLPSPEMNLWKQLHHLCKGARDDGSKTTLPSSKMILWKMLAWKLRFHLQRWYFEKCFTISKRCELEKRVIISLEMMPVNLCYHLHHVHWDDNPFFNPSPEMRSRKVRNHLWRWCREMILKFRDRFMPQWLASICSIHMFKFWKCSNT